MVTCPHKELVHTYTNILCIYIYMYIHVHLYTRNCTIYQRQKSVAVLPELIRRFSNSGRHRFYRCNIVLCSIMLTLVSLPPCTGVCCTPPAMQECWDCSYRASRTKWTVPSKCEPHSTHNQICVCRSEPILYARCVPQVDGGPSPFLGVGLVPFLDTVLTFSPDQELLRETDRSAS